MKPDTHTHTQHTRTSLHARTHTPAVLGWLLILCIPLLLLFEQVVAEMLKQRHLLCVCVGVGVWVCVRVHVSARSNTERRRVRCVYVQTRVRTFLCKCVG